MKGEKQSRQDLLEKKVQALINVVQQLLLILSILINVYVLSMYFGTWKDLD